MHIVGLEFKICPFVINDYLWVWYLCLEELVLKIGYDPSNVKVVEEMLKKKNSDIPSLRKQLKLPRTEDSQAKEIAETEGEKDDMLKLIME